MDINYYKQYEPIFGSWRIICQIGEGSFGKVFEIEREDFGVTYRAALKAITVPASESELLEVKADGMDDASVRTYFGSFVEELVKEFALMSRLKGNSNVVSYEDHQVIEHPDDIGWDILIRMELLTPLNRYTSTHTVTRQDVIKLGIDLCRALELCQKYNIIHRDIKPENIFVSDTGDFKLGDFGIARTVEKTTSGLSKKGTYTYMAPEVYKGEAYGSTVDIYSLGIVLYRLLNGNRTPFLPAAPAPITHADRENALARRFSGSPLPAPSHAEGRLAEIVQKACAYDPRERYSSPMQMRQELESILYSREESRYIYPEGDDVPQDSVHYVKTGEEPPVAETEATQRDSEADAKDDGAADKYGDTVSDFGGTANENGDTAEEADHTMSDFERRDSAFSGSPVSSSGSSSSAQKSRGKVFIAAAAVCVAFIMILVLETGRRQEHSGQYTASTDTVSQAAENTIYVGVYDTPEKDKYPEEGAWNRTSERFALEYINGQYPTVTMGGKEYQIELLFSSQMEKDYTINLNEDGFLDFTEYENTAATFFEENGCAAVIGAYYSAPSVTLAASMAEYGIPDIETSEFFDVTSPSMDTGKVFCIRNSTLELYRIMLDFAVKELQAESVLFVTDVEGHKDDLVDWTEYAKEIGLEVIDSVWYEDSNSLKSAVEKHPDCDVIYADFTYGSENTWTDILQENGCEAAVLGAWQGNNGFLLPYLENSYCFRVGNNGEKEEEQMEIADYVMEKQRVDSVDMGFTDVVDAYQILLKALALCSTEDELADALHSVSLEGLTGNFSFSENGLSNYTSVSYLHQDTWKNYIFD